MQYSRSLSGSIVLPVFLIIVFNSYVMTFNDLNDPCNTELHRNLLTVWYKVLMDLTSLSCSYIFNDKYKVVILYSVYWAVTAAIQILTFTCTVPGLPQVRKWSWRKILQGHGEAMEVYLESGKIVILN